VKVPVNLVFMGWRYYRTLAGLPAIHLTPVVVISPRSNGWMEPRDQNLMVESKKEKVVY